MTTPVTPEMSAKENLKKIMRQARDQALTTVTGDYKTYHELEFIAGLGWHSPSGVSRKVLLERYLIGIKKREHWGHMSKKEVFAATVEAIAHA